MFGLFCNNRKPIDYGCTLATCLILPNKQAYIATVGDSRCLILNKQKTTNVYKHYWESVDHNIKSMPEERQRVVKSGGIIEEL
eukprot:UN28501